MTRENQREHIHPADLLIVFMRAHKYDKRFGGSKTNIVTTSRSTCSHGNGHEKFESVPKRVCSLMLCGLIAESDDRLIVFTGAHNYDKAHCVFENIYTKLTLFGDLRNGIHATCNLIDLMCFHLVFH